MADTRPNILFITADQWRGDCVGYAGHKVVKTPNMDALAAEGTAFLRHYAAAAPCSPARAAIYTGLFQMNNRVVSNGAPLDDRFDNIARAARRAGYVPTLFGYTDISFDPREYDPADPALRSYEGVLPGFEMEQELIGDAAPWKAWLRSLGYPEDVCADPYRVPPTPGQRISTEPAAFAAEHSQTAYLVGRTLDWLEMQRGDQPWFAHLSLIHPHPPFVAPAPYNDMYEGQIDTSFRKAEADVTNHPIPHAMRDRGVSGFLPGAEGQLGDLSPEDFARIRSVYYGLITEVDAQLGRLFDALKGAGEWDNTIIIVMSDHAEMMGDYRLLGKGGFFRESQHIPMVICGPGMAKGQVCRGFTSGVDLFPTLLAQMGVAPKHAPDGHDLGPVLRGETGDTGHDCALWEFDFRDEVPAEILAQLPGGLSGCHLQAMLTDNLLYVSLPDMPPLLFDLTNADNPLRNVADEPSYVTTRLHMAERLLRRRQLANDQTLANIRLGKNGAARIDKA